MKKVVVILQMRETSCLWSQWRKWGHASHTIKCRLWWQEWRFSISFENQTPFGTHLQPHTRFISSESQIKVLMPLFRNSKDRKTQTWTQKCYGDGNSRVWGYQEGRVLTRWRDFWPVCLRAGGALVMEGCGPAMLHMEDVILQVYEQGWRRKHLLPEIRDTAL